MVGAGLRSPNQIWDRLTDTASNPTNDPLLGAGIVQADKAVPTTLLRQLLTVAGIALVVVLVVSLVGRRRDPEVENG
jgi:hypothetical protein